MALFKNFKICFPTVFQSYLNSLNIDDDSSKNCHFKFENSDRGSRNSKQCDVLISSKTLSQVWNLARKEFGFNMLQLNENISMIRSKFHLDANKTAAHIFPTFSYLW